MPPEPGDAPVGIPTPSGMVHHRSPLSVDDTVQRLTASIERAGAKVFAVIDHSGEAERVGLALRDTRLVIFGNPAGGTPVMQVAPLAAIDLPLKVLVWADDSGVVWMTHLSGSWLADRHGIPPEVAQPLSAADALTEELSKGLSP